MYQKKYGIDDLEQVSKKVIQNAKSKILCFYGEMGVGKTTLIKEIVKQLGSKDRVSSPTFSLVNEYESENSGKIFHFDFYRIDDIDEAYQIGVENYLYSDSWCLIEWPEKISELLPQNVTIVDIKLHLNGERLMEIV